MHECAVLGVHHSITLLFTPGRAHFQAADRSTVTKTPRPSRPFALEYFLTEKPKTLLKVPYVA